MLKSGARPKPGGEMANQVSMANSGPADYRALPLGAVENIVTRFEERMDAAQMAVPPNKERVRKALRREGADRCLVRMNRLSMDVMVRYGDALADLFCQFPDDVVMVRPYDFVLGYQPPGRLGRLSNAEALMQEKEWVDEWGIGWKHAADGVGANPVMHPIKDWSQLDDYLRNQMPDPHAPGRFSDALPALAKHGSSKYCVGIMNLTLFERLFALRGLGNVLEDFYTNEKEIGRLCEALTEFAIGLVEEWGKTDISGIFLTDDWGSQDALMASPAMWRRYFKEHYRRIFAEVHRWGKDVIFHSCGNIASIIPDLIEVGVDVLDPLQPGPLNLTAIASQFGGKVAFSGAIDDQRLENYSPQEVKDMVRRTIDTLGRPFGNAYLIAAANSILPSVPLENLQAMFQACHEQ
jgi:uroporphyrinogen decarboxylase